MKVTRSWMRCFAMYICVFVLFGCSTPTVYLNKLYLSNDESQQVKMALEEQGFNVEVNELSFPSSIYSTSILYSPFLKDPSAIEKLKETLNNLHYNVDSISALVASNHWYTKNSIGLFLVPDGINPHSGKNIGELAFEYHSEGCDANTVLKLYSDGKFLYTGIEKTKVYGVWSITEYPYILLENDEPYLYYYYEIMKSKRVDRVGEIDIIKLKPLSNSFIISMCDMVYGIRGE